MLRTASHPWLTRVRPTATYTIQGARVELYVLPHTSLHRVSADALIVATDATLRMTSGFRKQLRDYAGFNLVEQEAVSCAPLPPLGIAITGAGRTKFKHVLHANLYDAQFTTAPELQLQALTNALQVAAERGWQTVAIADYTLDLRRALAEETAWTIAQAIAQRPASSPAVQTALHGRGERLGVPAGTGLAIGARLRAVPRDVSHPPHDVARRAGRLEKRPCTWAVALHRAEPEPCRPYRGAGRADSA
jgi:O-acetyl-ADP-ribose deacetylase (regulator of RNase III)